MKIRRLTRDGLSVMHRWLDEAAAASKVAPAELIEGAYSEGTDYPGDIEPRSLETRLEWAQYIDPRFGPAPASAIQADAGLWAWLTLYYFDLVCPLGRDGRRKISHRARYVPSGSDFRTYYRHLLEGAWRVFRAHRDDPQRTRALLAAPLNAPGELYEQFAARQELVTSATVLEVATRLYIDPSSGARKRGSGGARKGSPRRLAQVLTQFDVTYDIYAMAPDQLLTMLPAEFDRFRSGAEG